MKNENTSTGLPAFWNPEVLCEGSAFSMLPEDVIERNAENARKTIAELRQLLDQADPIYNFHKTILHGSNIQEFGTAINHAIRILNEIQESANIMQHNQ